MYYIVKSFFFHNFSPKSTAFIYSSSVKFKLLATSKCSFYFFNNSINFYYFLNAVINSFFYFSNLLISVFNLSFSTLKSYDYSLLVKLFSLI